jgi:hypothetical protein
MESCAVYSTGASMPFLRWRFKESMWRESSMALLRLYISSCRESILVVSTITSLPEEATSAESWGIVSAVKAATDVSSGMVSSGDDEETSKLPIRKEDTSAITKMKAKSRINMRVFLLTAAKVILLMKNEE